MEKTNLNRKALQEAYYVLMMLSKEELNRIPKNLLNSIKENKDNSYDIDIERIQNDDILFDTKLILAAIYSKYLSTDEEKDIINKFITINNDKNLNLVDIKADDINDIFNNHMSENSIDINNKEMNFRENSLVIKKKNILNKLLNKIKTIFRGDI